MTTTVNNFEGGGAAGGAGTAITTGNSGGTSGKAFATVTVPSGSSFTFSTTGMDPGGTFGGRWQLASAATAWFGVLSWTAGGTSLAARWVFCLNSLPSANLLLATLVNGSFADNMQVLLTSGNTIQTRNAAGVNLGSASSALSAGVVYGLEVQVDCGSTTANGTVSTQVYALSAPGTLLLNYSSGGATVNAGGGSVSPQPIQGTMGNSDIVANLDVTFDDLAFITGTLTPVGPPGTSATVTMGSALAVATAQPAVQVGSLSGPNYAGSAADLGNGTGSWASTANADGAPDSTYATWTVP